MDWTPVSYAYDGSFAGFLTCVFASYAHREEPMSFSTPEDGRISLWPERTVDTDEARAQRVYRSLAPRLAVLTRAVGHLTGEAHLLKGFTRFSEQEGVLVGEIAPKNRVLPLLRPHFCARYPEESFVLYDRTHREALFYRPRRWAIVPLEAFRAAAPGREERDFRRLWRRFYDTIAIEGRENPRCRMTQMPKRFWGTMTEFQNETEERKELAP